MIDLKLLNERIEASGIRKSFIADSIHISSTGLSKKLDGRSDFKCNEAQTIGKVLHLNQKDMMCIFFADKV